VDDISAKDIVDEKAISEKKNHDKNSSAFEKK
jgi:hypothetical protein